MCEFTSVPCLFLTFTFRFFKNIFYAVLVINDNKIQFFKFSNNSVFPCYHVVQSCSKEWVVLP